MSEFDRTHALFFVFDLMVGGAFLMMLQDLELEGFFTPLLIGILIILLAVILIRDKLIIRNKKEIEK
jgi:hypothetical protein